MKKITTYLFLLFLVGFAIGGILINIPPFSEPITKEYYIKPGNVSSFYHLSKELEQDKIIYSAFFFRLLARTVQIDKRVQSGYYEFNNQMGALAILFSLYKGYSKSIVITVIEGYDIYQVSKILFEKKIITDQRHFIEAAKSPKWIKYVNEKIGITVKNSIEGFIYPETYFIRKDASLDSFIRLTIDTFKEKMGDYLGEKTKKDVFYKQLIKASLVEKETSLPKERPLVASVIENRLIKKMKLRIDPTIIYALKEKGQAEMNKKKGKINIKREHFYLKNPYNTYYYRGLPPTPICSPSRASLAAVKKPAVTDYLFFVAKGKNSREHVFTSNFKDHEYFVNKHQKK